MTLRFWLLAADLFGWLRMDRAFHWAVQRAAQSVKYPPIEPDDQEGPF